MYKNIIAMFVMFQLMSYSTGRDDEWVDYTDMLRYDAVGQSMTKEDDPCAKCYKTHGLWAPLMILKHAPLADLLKLGLTLLIIILGHKLIGSLIRRWGSQNPNGAQQRIVDERHGEDANTEALQPGEEQNQRQQVADDPREAAQCLEQNEERDNLSDTLEDGRDAGTRRMSLDIIRPHLENQASPEDIDNAECPSQRGEGDGTESDYCSSHFPVPETTDET